ncbi:MAG: PPOX class F420-dependent oxidoreductase [Microthrixaceae bacterium]
MDLASEKYVALTTYRRNGDSSSTPVWIADLGDGTLGFTTPGSSLKVKRLRQDNRVLVQPSDLRGNARQGTEPVPGTAQVLQGADFDRVRAKIAAKYGLQVRLISLTAQIGKLFGKDRGSDTAIVITLD